MDGNPYTITKRKSMVKYHDSKYFELINDVLNNGVVKSDRTGTGTRSVFGRQIKFDISDGSIPLLTSKKIHTQSIIHELLWFLSGSTNTKYLNDNGVTIWNEWADENGELGPIYGKQWRKWKIDEFGGHQLQFDQVSSVIKDLKTNPDSRRMIVSAWNVSDLHLMKLHPCHAFFQFYAVNNRLSCMLTQRSADLFLGVPFNIAQYSILTRMIAHIVGFTVGELIVNFGDLHLYSNHYSQVIEQISRTPYQSPTLTFTREIQDIDSFKFEDFLINNYVYHPTIKGEVSI